MPSKLLEISRGITPERMKRWSQSKNNTQVCMWRGMEVKSDTVSTVSPSICHEVMGPGALILVFWILSFKPAFSLSSFTFIKRLTYWPGEFIFQCPIFLPFHTVHGVLKAGILKWMFAIPLDWQVDHVLSDLSTMTRPSWVALHGMAYSFIELDKAVVHVIRLVSFLWLWFSVCLPSDGEGWEAYGSFLMGETDWGGNGLRSITTMNFIHLFPTIEQFVDSWNKPHLVIM